MATLTLDEVRTIGIAAIRRVIGDTFTDVEVGYELQADDRVAHLFTLRFASEASWRHALALMSRMMGGVMDDLFARGDEQFAFIRILSDGSWDFRRDAAAE